MDTPPAPILSHYRLIEKIGEGGMGVVWKAEDTILGRTVAIKILPPDVSRDEARRSMFLDEARLASAASSAHVVQVYEFGRQGALDFIVMEYVEGRPLNKILIGRPLPPEKVAALGMQIALALSSAHRRGLLHRDLKPSNILVTSDGDVKVVDFGLATLFVRAEQEGRDRTEVTRAAFSAGPAGSGSQPAAMAGTLPYMSPEQVRGESLDARTDVFSLGIVLYEMSTGQRPFGGKTNSEVAAAIAAASPTPVEQLSPSIPIELARIVQKALARKPGERYQTMDDLAVDLKRLDRDLESGSAPSFERLRGAPRAPAARKPVAVWAGGALLALVVLAGVWWMLRGRSPLLDENAVIVMPFEIQGDDRGTYLGQALAEAIAVNLAEAEKLHVLSVPEAHGDVPQDPVKIARASGAARVVTGAIRREAQTLHVSLKLLDTATNRIVWGLLEDEAGSNATVLAANAARQLATKLNVEQRRSYEFPLYPLTSDPHLAAAPEASETLDRWHNDDTPRAVAASERLIQRFPVSLAAHAARAYLLDQQSSTGDQRAKAALTAELALMDQLDPHNPYGAYFSASWMSDEHHTVEARPLLRAVLSRPDLAPTCRAWMLRGVSVSSLRYQGADAWMDAPPQSPGRPASALDEEIRDLRQAVQLDPANAWGLLYLSEALQMTGKTEEAIGLASRAASLEPAFPITHEKLGYYLTSVGRWNEAEPVAGRACELQSANGCALQALALQHLGRGPEARARAERAPRERLDAVGALHLARYLALTGDRAAAVQALQAALERGLPPVRITAEADLESLRADSKYKALLAAPAKP